jgi:hypothetical protein
MLREVGWVEGVMVTGGGGMGFAWRPTLRRIRASLLGSLEASVKCNGGVKGETKAGKER